MKTAMRFFVAAVGIFLLTPRCLLAKDNINEGKAWLAAKTEPAEINVDGTWDSSEWGMMLLH